MAPTKKDGKEEKEAKLTPEQSAALMLDYLRKQNRPYSATDISTNLKNRVTKAAAAKLLKDMHERQEIEGRAAGKQIIYHAIQDEADEAGLERLQEMDVETVRLRDATVSLKSEEKEMRLALREGTLQVSIPELRFSVARLEHEKVKLAARLAKLKSGNLAPISIDEREKVNAAHRKWQKAVDARRKIRAEMWAEIAANLERDKIGETKEALGLEF